MYKERTIPVYVKSISRETPFVKIFTLARMDGLPLPRFSGGAHIVTYIEASAGLLLRHYSLTGNPDNTDHYQIAVRLSEHSKGGSFFWHHLIKEGSKLQISYPKNHFPLSFKAKHHVFYAAGIGITPFLSMMKDLETQGSSFELHYASPSKENCAFYSYLEQYYPKETHFYFSEDHRRISPESLQDHRIGTHVYFCGPDSFITDFSETATKIGYPKSSIHYERFTPLNPRDPKPFLVQLKNGVTIHVSEEDTLLATLHKNGIDAPYSCRVGRCGTCELPLLEGEADHYDSFLEEEQKRKQNCILTCVSRAKSSKLVIGI